MAGAGMGRGGMGMMGGDFGGGGGGVDFNELEVVMERFMWQSYPQYLQNTLFHSDKLEMLRKKTLQVATAGFDCRPLRCCLGVRLEEHAQPMLQDRLTKAYEFKAKGDEKIEASKPREALVQFELAYGLFKYCAPPRQSHRARGVQTLCAFMAWAPSDTHAVLGLVQARRRAGRSRWWTIPRRRASCGVSRRASHPPDPGPRCAGGWCGLARDRFG